MAYEMKPGQGSAFPNEKKTEDWHADFRGKVMLPDGKTHWLDITNKKTKDGKAYVTVKIGNQTQQQGEAYSAAHKPFPDQDNHNKAKANGFVDLDEDIPF
jgi:hypothetical protein